MRRNRWFWVLLVTVSLLLGACDWTQSGFDAANTHFNPYEPALTSTSVQHLTEAWSTQDAEADGVVADGVVYTHRTTDWAPAPDTAHAFDVSTGAVQWSTTVPHADRPTAVGNGLVYYSEGDAGTVALDIKTGAQRWSKPQLAVALDGTRLFAVSAYFDGSGRAGELVAINPAGQTLWSTTTGGEVTGAVVQGGHLIVMTFIKLDTAPHGIVVVSTYDESNGDLLRRVAVPAQDAYGNVNLPALTRLEAGSRLIYFYTLIGGDMFAADPNTGAVAWHIAPPQTINGFAVTPSAVVVTMKNRTSEVTAFNPTTGAPLWSATPAGVVGAPTVSDNLVFVDHIQDDPGVDLLVYDLSNGALITSYANICCGPIPAEGRLFIDGFDGFDVMVPSQ